MMKRKNNAGFSLVEILVAMAILVSVVIPVCSSMVVSTRVNGKTEDVLRAKIAVSSAVETLLAEGVDPNKIDTYTERFKDVAITAELKGEHYYKVTVSAGSVTVETAIRAVASDETEPDEEAGENQ